MRYLFVIVFFAITPYSQAQKLRIIHLTGNVYVYTTYNTYKGTRVSSNSMYVVTNAGIFLADVPWDTTQFQPLLDSIYARHNKQAIICIATHSHADRTAALEYYTKQGIKTFSSIHTDSLAKHTGEKRAAFLFTKDTVFNLGGYKIATFHPGHGHTADNIVLWLEKDKVLYAGCFIKSTDAKNLGNVADADLTEWPASLERLKQRFPSPKFIIPGHDSWGDPRSIAHTLELLKAGN